VLVPAPAKARLARAVGSNHIAKALETKHQLSRLQPAICSESVYVSQTICKAILHGGLLQLGTGYPQIIHFNRISTINHPFWGTPPSILGNLYIALHRLLVVFVAVAHSPAPCGAATSRSLGANCQLRTSMTQVSKSQNASWFHCAIHR
jgi:hypothetical protein